MEVTRSLMTIFILKERSEYATRNLCAGNRNPYRISVDQKNGFLYWGEVGPDANVDSLEKRGPRGYDEVNQARKAGFFGWPLFVGNNYPYHDYDYGSRNNTASVRSCQADEYVTKQHRYPGVASCTARIRLVSLCAVFGFPWRKNRWKKRNGGSLFITPICFRRLVVYRNISTENFSCTIGCGVGSRW